MLDKAVILSKVYLGKGLPSFRKKMKVSFLPNVGNIIICGETRLIVEECQFQDSSFEIETKIILGLADNYFNEPSVVDDLKQCGWEEIKEDNDG